MAAQACTGPCHCAPPRAGQLNFHQLDIKGFTGEKESVESSGIESLEVLALSPRPVSIRVHTERGKYIYSKKEA